MDAHLESLVDELRKSPGPDGTAPSIRLQIAPMRVSTDHAVSLGVVVTELPTNAVKHDSGPGGGGEIRVIPEPDGEGRRAILPVEVDGPGLGEGTAKGMGLGAKSNTALASGLRSAVEFDPGHKGVRPRLALDL